MSRIRALLAAPLAAVLLAAPAAAQEPPPQPTTQQTTITVTATGRVDVERPDELNERTIRREVERARDRVATQALRVARRQAVRLAYAAGLQAGALLSVNDAEFGTFDPAAESFFYGPGGGDGYCRTVTRRRRDGTRVRRERCQVPPFTARTVVATYAVSPRA
jgi:hypothetical protein